MLNDPMGAATRSNQQPSTDVVLISMPFGPLGQPSIGLSLLAAGLRPLGVSVKTRYFTLQFAAEIGGVLYGELASGRPITVDMVGEWIFAGTLFPQTTADVEQFVNGILRRQIALDRESEPSDEGFIARVLEARDKAEVFLDRCLEQVLADRPRIVGFTSIFQQQLASLALAQRIKARAPDTFIVFGGANCEGIMGVEMVRQFAFVDAVVSGEGDLIFPLLVQQVLNQQSVDSLRGVYTATNSDFAGINGQIMNAPSVRNMDELPVPDYSDFFAQYQQLELDDKPPVRLLFETSRGCWWGEKNHCTFCGLNGSTMTYRSKSAQRAMDELLALTSAYSNCPISVVDNILDMKYFKDFIPALIEQKLDLDLFYEVKANMRKEQVRMLREAGITLIQPGIESLSNTVLDMMSKGVRSIQNIQLLKWCKELGIKPLWNVLWGFPGEPPAEYDQMAALIPSITHLSPPGCAATIRLDRFSPNFDRAEELGFTDIAPYPAYRLIYPFAPEVVANLAYYFTFRYREAQEPLRYTQPVAEQIARWQRNYATSDLFMMDKGQYLLIWDLRPEAKVGLTVLQGVARVLYLACDQARTARQLGQIYAEHSGDEASIETIEAILDICFERNLILRDGGLYLSLAIPIGSYSPTRPILERFQSLLASMGQSTATTTVVKLADHLTQAAPTEVVA